MRIIKWRGFIISFLAFSFLFLSFADAQSQEDARGTKQEKKEYLTVEELLKTKAGELFVTRQFEAALKEFRELEREYPKDIVIKRYIGACLDHLRRDEEAIEAFEKVLALNSGDLPARQFLSKIHLRGGDLDKAEREFAFLVEHDKTGAFAPAARVEMEKIKRLRETQERAVQVAGRKISPPDFLKTKAAEHFMNARFEDAFNELEKLEDEYPGDPLIIRYEALTLDKLGRTDEAIQKFQEGLAIAPDNVALHYFFAQTLLRKRDYEGAKRELEYVVRNDESEAYRITARADLKSVDKIISDQKKARRKWKVDASGKIEWLRNPGSTPKHVGFRSGREIYSSGKFSNTLGFTYQLFKKTPWTGKVSYNYSQGLYTRSFSSLNTFGNTLGANLTYTHNFLGKPLLIDLGHSTAHTMLREQYYTTAFSQTASLIYSPMTWNRLIFSEKLGFTTYDGDGTSPDHTSRDGFNNTAGITSYFYLNQPKTVYTLLGFEYNYDATQGANYHKDEFSYRTALHFPGYYKTEVDIALKFKDTNYPKWGFPITSPGRRDFNYNLTVTLSRTFLEHWTARLAYDYTNVKSRDDNFTYINYGVSLSLAFTY